MCFELIFRQTNYSFSIMLNSDVVASIIWQIRTINVVSILSPISFKFRVWTAGVSDCEIHSSLRPSLYYFISSFSAISFSSTPVNLISQKLCSSIRALSHSVSTCSDRRGHDLIICFIFVFSAVWHFLLMINVWIDGASVSLVTSVSFRWKIPNDTRTKSG